MDVEPQEITVGLAAALRAKGGWIMWDEADREFGRQKRF